METQVIITEILALLHLEYYSHSINSVTEDMNTLVDHFNVFTARFPTTTVHSNDSCQWIPLSLYYISRESEAVKAYNLSCAPPPSVLETNILSSHDKQ